MNARAIPLTINGIEVVEMHRLQDNPKVWACTMADGGLVVADGEHLSNLIRAGWPTEHDVDPYERFDRLQVTPIPELPPIAPGTRRRNLSAVAWLVLFGFVFGLILFAAGGAA
ncbi:hypothetical protein ACTHQY_15120 [Rhodococcoides corynebacterioides]|uniref:hypothetical protein n=1 Tax=Rhodococcoides corynebacterioides TaxID=53972 RepID=UPI003F81E375